MHGKVDWHKAFFALLTIFYVYLKVTGVVEWGWLWVLCPIWIPPVIGFSIMMGSFFYLTSYAAFTTMLLILRSGKQDIENEEE